MKLQSSNVNKLMVGSAAALRAYLGAEKVWSSLDVGLQLHLEGPTGVTDLSGNGNDAVYKGTAGTAESEGRLAFSTPGTSGNYIELPLAALPDVFPYSFSCWVKAPVEANAIAIAWTEDNLRHEIFRVTPTQGRMITRTVNLPFETIDTTNTVTANTWVHLYLEHFSAQSRKVVLSGVTADAATSVAASGQAGPKTQRNTFSVGAIIRPTPIYYAQLNDSIRVYNRVLSDAEIVLLASERGYDT